jgi:hypothetical protein
MTSDKRVVGGVIGSSKHSIDRIDNDAGYVAGHGPAFGPGNCRWATPIEQNANLRKTVVVAINGEPLSLKRAAARLGLDGSHISRRFREIGVWALYGWRTRNRRPKKETP